MMVGQQPLPTTSKIKHFCCSKASPAIGHDGPEPLFKGQSLQWLHGSLKRHAGEALQHGDMLEARLDGADDGGVGGHSDGRRERTRDRLEIPSTVYDAQSPCAATDGDGGCCSATSY